MSSALLVRDEPCLPHLWMGTSQTQEDAGWLKWTNAHGRGPGSESQVWTFYRGLSLCSITHRLKFIRHQPCAKWWAKCFSILAALWSPLGDCGDLESPSSRVRGMELMPRLLEVKRTLYISGETSPSGLTRECPCGKLDLGQQ